LPGVVDAAGDGYAALRMWTGGVERPPTGTRVDRRGLCTWRRQVRTAELWITSGAATTSACTRSGGTPKAVEALMRDLFKGKPTRTAGAKRRGAEAARQPVSAGNLQSA